MNTRMGALLHPGTVIPAHPLALDEDGEIDWRSQRAVSRYYAAAGAHGIAVGVHTTQFPLHDDRDAFREVLRVAAEEAAIASLPAVAGVVGTTRAAVAEAEVARDLGYTAVLLSLHGCDEDADEDELVERARAVGEVMPTIAFYIQESVGGRYLSPRYWIRLFEMSSTIAVKVAPFDRYRTAEVAYAVLESSRWNEIAVLTGNDDAIVSDLVSEYERTVDGELRRLRIRGGLLGQWAVGTAHAVRLSRRLASSGETWDGPSREDLREGSFLTEINSAVFDVRHRFHGSVAGVNEVLRQQGLLRSARCLPGAGSLSPGQSEFIAEMRRRYPGMLDEDFIAERRDQWLTLS